MLWLVIRQYAVVPYEECRFIKSVMNSRKFKRTQSAFTLVEVMISTFIFGLVILVALVSVGKGIELVDASRQNTRASQILQSELELLRTLPWDTFKDQTNVQLTAQFRTQVASQFGSDQFDGEVEVAEIQTGLMLVAVTVNWIGFKGRPYSKKYYTYFADGGINDYFITP